MKVNFQWDDVSFKEDKKQSVEERIETDLETLMLEENDINIIFDSYKYLPHEELTGFITDFSSNNLYSFTCSKSNDNQIEYVTEFNKNT